jgi:hypothetical protein
MTLILSSIEQGCFNLFTVYGFPSESVAGKDGVFVGQQ